MFEKILVPLDGSRLAEDVLPSVASLATHLGSRVMLLHVVERSAPATIHGEHHIGNADEARAYLESKAGALRSQGIEVDLHVHDRGVSDVGAAIDSHAHEYGVDLLAMCKHGHSGLRHITVGSIAQNILRGGSTPILLRTPVEHKPRAPSDIKSILVPLDLQHDAESVLEVARVLAEAFDASITLICAIPHLAAARQASVPARLLPGATAESIRMQEEDAEEQLQKWADDLGGRGIAVNVRIRPEDAGTAILAEAKDSAADIIVLTTHARAGFEAWYTGSTGDRVITETTQTLLLLREL